MIFTLFAIAVGVALGLLIWAMFSTESGALNQLEDPSARLLPPQEVVDAIFNARDGEFIRRQNSPELMKLLDQHRRHIALLWLRGIKSEALAAISEYRQSARQSTSLSFASELGILYRTISFLGLHVFISGLVRTTSVFKIQGLLRRISEVSQPLLAYAPANAGATVAK